VTGLVRLSSTAALLAVRTAAAQAPAPAQPSPPPPPPLSLVEIKDEELIAETLAQITNDPAIRVEDPAIRTAAQALMIEAVKRLGARSYDQALANFLEAYARLPSPQILIHIGATLRDMGRPADAANTYQRYLDDPAADPQRAGEVRELLGKLDPQLTTLHVEVAPRGAEVSIDGGPFVPVGQLLVTRVRPGLHLLRVRKGDRSAEITINGFESESKRVDARAPVPAEPPTPTPAPAPTPTPTPMPPAANPPEAIPDRVHPWLTNGTQYSADSSTGHIRRTRSGYGGAEIAVTPLFELDDDGAIHLQQPERPGISSGAIALVRVDGKLRGVAGGLGIAISRGRFEGDLLALRSQVTGAYLGLRVRFLSGFVRPYAAAGVPAFLYDDADSTKLAVGVRAAGGVELRINEHLSIQGDLGYEHFFGVEDTMFEADLIIPTVGLIGRL
jgi:hypothetical protein